MTELINAQTVPAIAPHFRFQWEEAQQTYVILYPEGMVKLNPSAAEILKLCDGKTRVGGILSHLQEQFPDIELEQDVYTFLNQAHANGWLALKPANET